MHRLIQKVTQSFSESFNKDSEVVFHAPGRVNLIGEHTDYNNGFVLPCAIDRGTYMAIGIRSDNLINVVAVDNNGQNSQWQSVLPIEKDKDQSWANYLRGVNEQFLKRKLEPMGMDVVVTGNIPQGAGLSSSAALCVVFATAINSINRFDFSPTELALLCQAAENEYVGCNCGIMDQLISVAGQENHALLIDCSNLSYKPIEMPNDMQVIIVDSKVSRGLVGSKYNKRRKRCEQAANIMQVNSLRDADLDLLHRHKDKMEVPTFHRARHVITENLRTQEAALALRSNDYGSLSRLMRGSHVSMRDDFEITTSEIDYLVEIIDSVLHDRGGVRMTGGGFGGCVVALAPSALGQLVVDAVNNLYPEKTGLIAEIHMCIASSGAGKIENK
ncbi:MAG: galactokinase [Gammaproteobacteria bacterium]|nr:galactokinase [Gammaproteobacteria bacterium]